MAEDWTIPTQCSQATPDKGTASKSFLDLIEHLNVAIGPSRFEIEQGDCNTNDNAQVLVQLQYCDQ